MRASSGSPPSAGTNRSRISCCVSLPAAAVAEQHRVARRQRHRTAQRELAGPRCSSTSLTPAPSSPGPAGQEVRGARALGRHHRRAERRLRRAARAERRAVERLRAARAGRRPRCRLGLARRRRRPRSGNSRSASCAAIRLAQPQAARRDHADAAPGAVGDLEDLVHDRERGRVPVALRPRARTGSRPRRGPPRAAARSIAMPSSRSTGSNPVTTIGTPKSRAIGSYSRQPMIAQTCPAARNPCTRFPGETRIAMIAGGTSTCDTSSAKFVTPSSLRLAAPPSRSRARWSRSRPRRTRRSCRGCGARSRARRAASRRRARRRRPRAP